MPSARPAPERRGTGAREASTVNLAICHPYVIPARGGAEPYVPALCRRLSAAGHEVHLYACAWDASALPQAVRCHHVASGGWPRFLRPWRFSSRLTQMIAPDAHDLTLGFD